MLAPLGNQLAHLGYKDAGDSVGNTQQRLLGIFLGLAESLWEVSGVGEEGGPVRGFCVQLGLLQIGLSRHDWGCKGGVGGSGSGYASDKEEQ